MKIRGFEPVKQEAMQHVTEYVVDDTRHKHYPALKLPTRADERSAGYDFYAPCNMNLIPQQKFTMWTNVKAYMDKDEVLQLYPRSSLGIKGLMLANTVGIIDASYYENESNDGNIGIVLLNTSGKTIVINKGDRIAQGIFTKFLTADNDTTLATERVGGLGSSGK